MIRSIGRSLHSQSVSPVPVARCLARRPTRQLHSIVHKALATENLTTLEGKLEAVREHLVYDVEVVLPQIHENIHGVIHNVVAPFMIFGEDLWVVNFLFLSVLGFLSFSLLVVAPKN